MRKRKSTSAVGVQLARVVFGVLLLFVSALAARADESYEGVDVGGPFELTDHHGRRVTDQDFRGHYMLIFFGYTFCPDVCPTELGLIAEMIDLLGEHGAQLLPLFITIDPERDDAATLSEYVALFHPRIVGLTGSAAEIARVADAYKVIREEVPFEGGHYLINHSASTYLMGPDGGFIGSLDYNTPPEAAAAALRDVLQSGGLN